MDLRSRPARLSGGSGRVQNAIFRANDEPSYPSPTSARWDGTFRFVVPRPMFDFTQQGFEPTISDEASTA